MRPAPHAPNVVNPAANLSIIMPAHNEEPSLRILLPRLQKILDTLTISYEVILVDDGSEDATSRVAGDFGYTVLRNDKRSGKGASIRKGLKYVSGKFVVTMDADGSNDPLDLPFLIQPLLSSQAEVVLGSRFKTRFEDSAPSPAIRSLGNRFFNLAILLTTRFSVTDSQSGYRSFARHVLDAVQTFSSGYEWETEVLLKIVARHYKITEIPIHYRERIAGFSRLDLVRDSIKFMTLIMKNALGTLA